MNKSRVKSDFIESTRSLLNILSGVQDNSFNEEPGGDRWTVGMTAEHLIKVESGTLKLFSGPADTTERDPAQKIKEIKERLLNYETGMTAYGPIVPDEKPKEKTKVLEKIQDIRQQLTGLIDIQDLSKTITGFEHPLFGYLTRIEWIYFNIYHSRRHAHRIIEINKSLGRHSDL